MRIFIAIPIPEEAKNFLEEFTGRLKQANADVKWVEKENLHFTLRFLGEVEEEKIPLVEQSISSLANFRAFQAETGTLGVFPSPSSPRVIWIGLKRGEREMLDVAKALNRALREQGFPPEDKPFQAHLTIGRVRSSRNLSSLKKLLAEIPPPVKEFPVNEVCLFKSTLTPAGPIYDLLYNLSLK